jgi:antirestriction protein
MTHETFLSDSALSPHISNKEGGDMHEREPTPRFPEHEVTSAETDARLRPRIYAASLSDYNNGILHGQWIDATSEVEEMQQAINQMLAASPTTARYGEPAEEWAIHDYEDFGDIRVDENQSLATIAKWADGIERHGEAFAAWIAHVGEQSGDLIEQFEDCYQGEWESVEVYAQYLLDELGAQHVIGEAPEWLQPYLKLDVEGFARDLEASGDVEASPTMAGATWIWVWQC